MKFVKEYKVTNGGEDWQAPMEGLSVFTYKNKEIYYIDYSGLGNSKEKVLQLVRGASEEYARRNLAPKSVLALTNVDNLPFDMEIVNTFKEERHKVAPYEKKVAIIGLKGIQMIAYRYIISFTQHSVIKVFDSETEAKEWLIKD
jgi:hypothetical protein